MSEALANPAPKYLEVKASLRRSISSMPEGAAIPAERDLARSFGVSRMTARRAVMELMEEGLLTRHVGRGTFVSRPRLDVRLNLTSFTEDVRSKGMTPGAVVLRVEHATAGTDSPFATGTPLVVLERLRTGDGRPLAVERTALASNAVPGLAELDLTGSLYSLLSDRYSIRLEAGEQRIVAVECPTAVAGHLGIRPGAPVLRMDRRSGDRLGLVEHTTSWYRADVYELTATLHPAQDDPIRSGGSWN